METVNSLRITGRAGSVLQVVELGNNRRLGKVSLAVNHYTGQPGNQTKHTEWFTLVFWNERVEMAERVVRKGQIYQVEGRVRINSYEAKDGTKRSSLEIIVNEISEVIFEMNES